MVQLVSVLVPITVITAVTSHSTSVEGVAAFPRLMLDLLYSLPFCKVGASNTYSADADAEASGSGSLGPQAEEAGQA